MTTNKLNVNDIVLNGIIQLLDRNPAVVWQNTMTNLNSNLAKVLGKKQATSLPKSPSALRMVVNRVVNRLRSRGVGVRFGRTPDHTRTRFVRFTRGWL